MPTTELICDDRNEPNPYQWLVKNAQSSATTSSKSCEFKPEFDAEQFCNIMANEVILFLGDSITWEMYESLAHLLGKMADIRLKYRSAFGQKYAIVINACGGGDEKSDRAPVTLIFSMQRYLERIESAIEQTFPTTLILNMGAHYRIDKAYEPAIDNTLNEVSNWQQLCKSRNLPCRFFWRTTTPGISNCMNFTEPVNNITAMEDYVASNPTKYHWERFKHQNGIAVRKIESSGLNHYEIIDGYEIGITRPDIAGLHSNDCLHSCKLGVADVYNTILLHYLRANKTSEGILRVSKYEYSYNRTTNVLPSGTDIDWLGNGLSPFNNNSLPK
jgi:hypothetical protein